MGRPSRERPPKLDWSKGRQGQHVRVPNEQRTVFVVSEKHKQHLAAKFARMKAETLARLGARKSAARAVATDDR